MLIFKPDWLGHFNDKGKRTSIFTCDVNPRTGRLATGAIDSAIKIWDIAFILNFAKSADASDDTAANAAPSGESQANMQDNALLCTLKQHSGAVMSLRWSPCGSFLASGSDDASVVISEKEPLQENATFDYSNLVGKGFSDAIQREKYRVVKKWKMHEGDVTGVAWSADGAFLATCGVDDQAFIYESKSWNLVKALDLRNNCVGLLKGLAWDPLSKYLAVHPDNGAGIYLYRVQDWQLEEQVKSAFEEQGLTVVQRCDWSPDGRFLAASNGSNRGLPVVPLIEPALLKENSQDKFLSFVGHEDHIECVRFHPSLFEKIGDGNSSVDRNDYLMYCAVGSQDRSVSMWRTELDRPVVVLQNLASHSIMDLCWLPSDCAALIAVSYDGSIIIVRLEQDDPLGKPLSTKRTEEVLKSLKRKLPSDDIELASTKKVALEKVHPLPQASSSAVRVNKEGKKRIQPTLLTTNVVSSPALTAITSHSPIVEKIVVTQGIETSKIIGLLPLPSIRPSFSVGDITVALHDGKSLLISSSQPSWSISLRFHPSLMTHDDEIIVLANATKECQPVDKLPIEEIQSCVYFYSRSTGKLLRLPWIMESQVCFLKLYGARLLIVTTSGALGVWDLKAMKSSFLQISMRSILENLPLPSGNLKKRRVLDVSLVEPMFFPIVEMSDRSCYFYDPSLGLWQLDVSRTTPYQTIYSFLEDDNDFRDALVSDHLKDDDNMQQLELYLAAANAKNNMNDILKWTCIYFKRLLRDKETSKIVGLLEEYCERKEREILTGTSLLSLDDPSIPSFAKDMMVVPSVSSVEPRPESLPHHGEQSSIVKEYLLEMLKANTHYQYLLESWA